MSKSVVLPPRRFFSLPLLALVAGGLIAADGASAAAVSTVTSVPQANVIVNGDAEADVGGTVANGSFDVDATGWDPETGAFTVTRYGVGNHPSVAESCKIGGAANFFSGGHSASATSTATQVIDVSAIAATIDLGTLKYQVSAHLGGYLTDGDNARIDYTFRNAAQAVVGTNDLGPATRAQRADLTSLLWWWAVDTVPATTRTIEVKITQTRVNGSANDGYADNLVLALGDLPKLEEPTGCVTPPTPTPAPAPTPVPTPVPGPEGTPTPTPAPGATPVPTPTTVPNLLPPPAPTKQPKKLAEPTKVPGPSKGPVVSTTKPKTTPAGGTTIVVTPSTTCNLTATSVFAKQGGTGARAAAAGSQVFGGLGTSTVKLAGATVTLPKQQIGGVLPGQAAQFQIQPVTTPTKPSATKPVDPPKFPIVTTVKCEPVKTKNIAQTLGFNAGFDLGPLGGLSYSTGAVSPKPVKSTVNPPATQPATGGATAPALTPGLWSGKLNGFVGTKPGQNVPAGTVSFTVQPDLTVTGFVLEGAETCVAAAGSKQGGSVESIPYFTTVSHRRPIPLSPTAGFPKKGFATYVGSAVGTRSIKIGTGAAQPGLVASSPTAITGTIEALRTNGGEVPSSCTLRGTFSATPGGTAVTPVNLGSGYSD